MKKPLYLLRFIIHFHNWLFNLTCGLVLELVDSLDLKSSGIYSRGGSSPPEATKKLHKQNC